MGWVSVSGDVREGGCWWNGARRKNDEKLHKQTRPVSRQQTSSSKKQSHTTHQNELNLPIVAFVSFCNDPRRMIFAWNELWLWLLHVASIRRGFPMGKGTTHSANAHTYNGDEWRSTDCIWSGGWASIYPRTWGAPRVIRHLTDATGCAWRQRVERRADDGKRAADAPSTKLAHRFRMVVER